MRLQTGCGWPRYGCSVVREPLSWLPGRQLAVRDASGGDSASMKARYARRPGEKTHVPLGALC